MKTILAFAIVWVPLALFAQVKTTHQPASTWFETTVKQQEKLLPAKAQLLQIKQENIPANFQDTLRKYDWVDLGGYFYVDKKYAVNYQTKPTQYQLWRLGEKDTVLNFTYVLTGTENGEMQHSNFFIANNPVYTVKKINNQWVIEMNYGHGNKEYVKIISYKNGILIYDTPINGKVTDKKNFSRMVCMAKEKSFEWNKTTK